MEKTYTIGDLELLSGIKAHTIRIWEQRYGLFTPMRTDTNIRRYSEEDLRRLLNVAILLKKGYKISRIAAFRPEEIDREAYRVLASDRSPDVLADGLRQAMITLDEEAFNRVFANLTMRQGFEETILQVVYPFLDLVGALWQTGVITPLHEHFVSSLIRQKIIVAIDMLPVPHTDRKQGFALASPEGEFHEIGLLFANYLLRIRGYHSVYVGANVPVADMVSVLQESGLRRLFLSVVSQPAAAELPGYVLGLSNALPKGTEVFLNGRQTDALTAPLPDGVHVLSRITALTGLL